MTIFTQRIFLSSVALPSGNGAALVSISAQGEGELRLATSVLPNKQFAPSNAQAEDGRPIPAEQLFPAALDAERALRRALDYADYNPRPTL
jgi:hypothetical protein